MDTSPIFTSILLPNMYKLINDPEQEHTKVNEDKLIDSRQIRVESTDQKMLQIMGTERIVFGCCCAFPIHFTAEAHLSCKNDLYMKILKTFFTNR